MKNKIVLCSILALGLCISASVSAQNSTNANNGPGQSVTPPQPAPLSSNEIAAAQASGNAILDNLPLFRYLTNIPTATFDQAKYEIMLGVENTGAQMNNSIDLHYNFKTNFYLAGSVSLGSVTSSTFNEAGLGVGWRKAWPNWEMYAGVAVDRNFTFNNFEGGIVTGCAYKPSSGFAVFVENEALFTTLISSAGAAPKNRLKTGISLDF